MIFKLFSCIILFLLEITCDCPARQLPIDWLNRYSIQPVLMETFVETGRFAGTCYRAANWIHVGQTKSRGKLGPYGVQSVPIKDIFLYPLTRKFKSILKS